jgi:signal peptide peptidase SppA
MPSRANLDALFEAPWALLPKTLSRIVEWGRQAVQVDAKAIVALDGPHGGATRFGTVSVTPVYGVIEHRSDWMMEMFGGTSVAGLREALRADLADPSVKAIVLDIDSPGGTVAGITELAAEIRGARGGPKPIVAQVNTMCASAAAWLAFQCDEVICTPSGSVGSIGVYAIHQEASRMLDEMGITTTIISAGPHKTEGNEFEPLTDEARVALQEQADAAYGQFVADVAVGRRVPVAQVEANYGGGRMLTAKKALAAGMVDRIETLAQTVARLGRASTGRRTLAAARLGPDLEASAIGRHKTATSEDPWDGPANEARLPSGNGAAPALRKAHAWVDDEGDPEDRPGVWNHFAGHERDADREVPSYEGTSLAERLTAIAAEGAELAEAVDRRAKVRVADHQPAISTVTERALRATRDAIDTLLSGEPGADAVNPPGAPAPSTPPPAASIPARFRSRADWLRYLETHR